MNAKNRSAKKHSSRKMKYLKKKSSTKKRSAKKRLSKKIKSLKKKSSAKKQSTKKRSSRKIKSLKKYQKKSLTKNFRGGGEKLREYATSKNPVKKAISDLTLLLAKSISLGERKRKEKRKEIEEKIDTIINEKKGHLEKANINIGLLKSHLLKQFLLGQDTNYITINTKILDKALDKLINEIKDANKELDKSEYKKIVENLINYMKSGIRRSSLKFTTNKKRDSLSDDMSRRQSKIPSLRKSLFELRKNSESKQNDTQSRKNSKGWKSLIQEYNQKRLSTKKIGGAAKKSPEEKEEKKKQKELEKEQKKEEKKKQKELEKEQKKEEKEREKAEKKKQKELEKEEKKKQKEPEKKPEKEQVSTAVIQNDYDSKSFSPMLAHKYNGENPVGYCISEKLDGYRAILSEHGFMSRNNNLFNAPKEYIKDILDKLPKGIVLDGELYTKRGDFAGMGVVRKKVPIKSEWEKITYMVFDLPLVQEPFYKRYEMMQKLLINVPHVKLVECNMINSLEEFEKTHSELIKSGAEGSMLRNIHSYYISSRTRNLLKVKDAFDDEVEVIDMENGEGKYKNVMGKLIVKWNKNSGKNTNVQFDVGSGFSDEDRQNAKKLFKPGTLITIKYWEITPSGKPRFPIYERIRYLE